MSASLSNERAIGITFFYGAGASRKTETALTVCALADRIASETAAEKSRLGWLKLARFGEIRTEKNSLRHDANVLTISGVEGDYDDESITFEEAVEIATKAGLHAILYTSPSHTEDTPRWRVLCPTSKELPPGQRRHLMGRLNGLYRGVLSNESWTLSQSYFFGSVSNNPSHRVEIIEGLPIDEMDELDEVWIGPPNTKAPVNGERVGRLDEASLLQAITEGRNYHVASMRLLGRWAIDGVPFLDARDRLVHAMRGVFPPDRDARWHARFADIDRCLFDIYGKQATKVDAGEAMPHQQQSSESENSSSGWAVVNPVDLADRHPPERQWIVQDWLPVGVATADYGDGGMGKTLLAQQLQTSCATGTPWCGLAVQRCRSIGLYCEDDPDELHRRQERICTALGIDMRDLEDMRWISGVGQDNALVDSTGDSRMRRTPRLDKLLDLVRKHDARLVVLDTAADLFLGNENDRGQVRHFIGQLTALALEARCAVLLNAHPSRSGIASGALDGGSTAWSNSVRSRWSLARPDSDGDSDTNERILTRRKANYASIGDTIKLRWQNGVLLPVTALTGLSAMAAAADAESVFLTLLARCTAEGRLLSDSKNAGNSAPKIFGMRPDRQGFSRRDFESAMQRLFADGKIRMEAYGRANDRGQPRRMVAI